MYLEEVDAALGCAEVLLEREDVVLEAVALVLGGEELEAEGAIGDGETQGGVDGVAHVLLGAAGERELRNPSILRVRRRRLRRRGSHGFGDGTAAGSGAMRCDAMRSDAGRLPGRGERKEESSLVRPCDLDLKLNRIGCDPSVPPRQGESRWRWGLPLPVAAPLHSPGVV